MKRRGFLKGLVSLAVTAPAVGVGASGVVSEAVQRPLRRGDSAVSGLEWALASVTEGGKVRIVYDAPYCNSESWAAVLAVERCDSWAHWHGKCSDAPQIRNEMLLRIG